MPYGSASSGSVSGAVFNFEDAYRDRGFGTFLVGPQRARKEVNLENMGSQDRVAFDVARAKEWKCWQLF